MQVGLGIFRLSKVAESVGFGNLEQREKPRQLISLFCEAVDEGALCRDTRGIFAVPGSPSPFSSVVFALKVLILAISDFAHICK